MLSLDLKVYSYWNEPFYLRDNRVVAQLLFSRRLKSCESLMTDHRAAMLPFPISPMLQFFAAKYSHHCWLCCQAGKRVRPCRKLQPFIYFTDLLLSVAWFLILLSLLLCIERVDSSRLTGKRGHMCEVSYNLSSLLSLIQRPLQRWIAYKGLINLAQLNLSIKFIVLQWAGTYWARC